MDALDGGHWQFGDDSMPDRRRDLLRRHLRAPPAGAGRGQGRRSMHLKEAGPGAAGGAERPRTAAMAEELNAFCREVGAPIEIRHFASLWRVSFARRPPAAGPAVRDDAQPRRAHPRQLPVLHDDGAHARPTSPSSRRPSRKSVAELQEAEFLPRRAGSRGACSMRAEPPVPGARLGRDPDGKPAWFVPQSGCARQVREGRCAMMQAVISRRRTTPSRPRSTTTRLRRRDRSASCRRPRRSARSGWPTSSAPKPRWPTTNRSRCDCEGRSTSRPCRRALHALCDRHEALRATIGPDGPSLSISAEPRLCARRGSTCSARAPSASAGGSPTARRDAVETPFDLGQRPAGAGELAAPRRERRTCWS